MPTVDSLHVYPLKSAKGVARDVVHVERRGPSGDRRWMGVDADGTFLSQRTHPRLALVSVTETTNGLRLDAPERKPLDVPTPGDDASRLTVTVFGDAVEAALASEAAHRWLSDHLGTGVRLVHLPTDAHRAVDAEYAVRDGDEVSFADGYPLLLTTIASLDALNAHLANPLPMNRFRPNLVVRGTDAWAEDDWTRIRVGDVLFHAVKPCARCAITTVDQNTAVRGKEPLRTLATLRRDADTGKVYFGWNLIPDAPGTIRVGDEVRVKS